MPIDRPTEVKVTVKLWYTFHIRQKAAKKYFKSFLET